MPRTEEPLQTPDVRRDIAIIKKVTIAALAVCSLTLVLIFAFPYLMEATKSADEAGQYITQHKEKVAELFKQDKGLTFRDMILSWQTVRSDQGGQVQSRFDILVAVDPSMPVGTLDKRADALKSELDKILINPPRGARVRLVLSSELVRE